MGTPIYKGKGGMGSMNDPETGGKKKKDKKNLPKEPQKVTLKIKKKETLLMQL